MSLAPSGSTPPAGPPAEASRPLLPPSPPPTQGVDNGSAPPLPQTAAPFASLPSPPTPVEVLLPPANSVPPPVATTPQPKVSPVASPLPPVIIPSFRPPAASPLPPLLEAPPPTGLPLVEAPPPKDPSTPIAPVVPVSSRLPPEPPIPPVTSPPFSTRSLPPKSPPQSPIQIPPLEPKTYFPPLPTPLRPEVVSPPPLTTPFAQEAAPPALTTPSTVLFPPTRPSYPPEFALQPPATPELPTSTVLSPPLSLPLVGETLPVASKQSHLPIGLIVVCAVGGIFLLALLGLLCICYKHRKNHATKEHKPSFLTPKDDAKTMVAQHSQQNFAVLPVEHVVSVQPEAFPLLLPTTSKVSGSCSLDLRPENQQQHQSPYVDVSLSTGTITYEELLTATNGFSEGNLLGQGGFGFVHKGVLRGGKEVAVKKLREGSRQGEREFQTEVEIIGRVHHKHLVSLIGYCITGAERLLVYEFIPNNTLEFHLQGEGQPVMEWATRLKIAIGSAKGLAYLHEDCYPKIIHRDIKAANILLDHNFEPKVSDFGLAKSFPDSTGSISHISTQVVGTFGYLAPEYASSGKVTDKSDVYSYGVMLLELITGRPPIKDTESEMRKGLVDWARPLLSQALEDDKFEALVDPRLETDYDRSEMASMVSCAAACVRHSAWLRPRMSQIVLALEGNISAKALNEGTKPGHSSNYDSNQYQEDMMRHKVALSAQPQGISECSGTTTEYGLNPSSLSSDGSSR